jgi:F-actin capping protein, beta subunit
MDTDLKDVEALLHCVPLQNIGNALTLLSGTNIEESASKNMHYAQFELVQPVDGKPFLASPYNRRNQQHRSPWDNTFYPKENCSEEDPSPLVGGDEADLRNLEISFNEIWTVYTTLYYGHQATGSVYLKATKNGSFEGLFGIRKVCSVGSWNSASLVQVIENSCGEFAYQVESMVQCLLEPKMEEFDRSSVSAVVSKRGNRVCRLQRNVAAAFSHIETIGTMIETNEIYLRSNLEKVLIPKNQEAIESILAKKRTGLHSDVNPVAGMLMNSDLLKRRLAKQSNQSLID